MILMLEDDPARLARFRTTVGGLPGSPPLSVWRNAHAMIRDLPAAVAGAALIALDHDLEPERPGEDPGDGLEVARWLVEHAEPRPVVIHTSNAERGTWMAGEFELAGWPFSRVLPFGERWIEEDWMPVAARLLRGR